MMPTTTANTAPAHVSPGADFHIFTTFRLDSILLANAAHTTACGGHTSDIYLLPYHFQRLMDATAAMAGFQIPQELSNIGTLENHIHEALKDSPDGATGSDVRRGKVSMWPSGRLEVNLVPVPQSSPILLPSSFDNHPDPIWIVILDDEATETTLYTEIKTSYRTPYDRARQTAGLSPSSNTEVLLYNQTNEVMDGSITNVYFYRNNKWVTPDSGGLKGAARRFALDRGLCSIASVKKDSLKNGEVVWLSNAYRGFFPAIFSAR